MVCIVLTVHTVLPCMYVHICNVQSGIGSHETFAGFRVYIFANQYVCT